MALALLRAHWEQTIVPLLDQYGYVLQAELAALRPPAVPTRLYLPYRKDLGPLGYGHVVLLYTPVARSPQEFVVELMRYEGTSPDMAFAMPVLGAPLTNVAAHLAGPNRDVLPLQELGYPHWWCSDATELAALIPRLYAYLAIALAALDDPATSQIVWVDGNAIADVLLAVHHQQLSLAEAVSQLETATVSRGLHLWAGTWERTAAVSATISVIRLSYFNGYSYLRALAPDLIPYLVDCLRGTTVFDRDFYGQHQNAYVQSLR